MKFNTIDDLLNYTENIKGKTFKEIDSENLLKNQTKLRNKGLLGQIVETGFYKYPLNNRPEADFNKLGVELKVTAYKKNKNSISAKERISLSKIDYNKIVNEEFEYSKLISKNSKILIIWYEYEKGKDIGDFKITDYQLYEMKQDEEVFRNDFNIIKNKVLAGKAHELSEGDTSYLGACTKSSKSTDRTSQPFSNEPAKPRAFSLKNSYVTGILRNHLQNEQQTKQFKTVDEYVNYQLKPYFNKNQLEILELIKGTPIKKIPKNISKIITNQIIGKDSELPKKDDLFTKTSFIIKNLPITINNKPKERMTFKTLKLDEFQDSWDESYWKQFFEETTLITILWKEPHKQSKNGERILNKAIKISFTDDDLESFKKTYEKVQEAIQKQDYTILPTPHSFENQHLEIVPKASKGTNIYKTFLEKNNTKISFGFNKNFLDEKLKKLI